MMNFAPTHKLWFFGNHKPRIQNTDLGIWRRVRVLPFTQTVDERDRVENFAQRELLPEISGILAWAVKGAVEWGTFGGLGMASAVSIAVEQYRSEMDTFGQFLEEACDTADASASSTSSELYQAFCGWMKNSGERPMSRTAFGKRLTEYGFDPQYDSRRVKRWCKGIRPRERDQEGMLDDD